jgi:hypothetical protein
MIVHDPTAYEIHFIAIPMTREGKKLPAVVEFLNTTAAQFARAVGKDAPYRIMELVDFTELVSDRLTSVEPTKDSSGRSLELDVRTLHDAAMIRTTVLHKGSFELDKVKALNFCGPLPPPQADVSNYLGAFRVLYVETDRPEGAKRAGVGEALATAFGWTWLAEAEPVVTPLGTMLFGVQPRKPHQQPVAPTLDLIFVGGRDAAAIAERYPLHPFLLTLPELALCHLKVRNAVENLRFTWLKELADRERELRDLLPKRGEPMPPLPEMLDLNNDITARQADLVDAVVHVQAELRTMRINRDNFAAAAQPFKRAAERLENLLIDRWMSGTELQADNDIGYAQGALERAETHFKRIEDSAEADQARELRTINRRMIFLAVLGVLVGLLSAYPSWKPLLTPASPAPQSPPKAEAKER